MHILSKPALKSRRDFKQKCSNLHKKTAIKWWFCGSFSTRILHDTSEQRVWRKTTRILDLEKKVQGTAEYRVWRKSTNICKILQNTGLEKGILILQDTGSGEGVIEYFRVQALEKENTDTAGYRIWRRNTRILQDTRSVEGVLQYCRIQDLEKNTEILQDTGSGEGILQYCRIQDLEKNTEILQDTGSVKWILKYYRIWRRVLQYCRIQDLEKNTEILEDKGSEEGVLQYCRIQALKKNTDTAGYRIWWRILKYCRIQDLEKNVGVEARTKAKPLNQFLAHTPRQVQVLQEKNWNKKKPTRVLQAHASTRHMEIVSVNWRYFNKNIG